MGWWKCFKTSKRWWLHCESIKCYWIVDFKMMNFVMWLSPQLKNLIWAKNFQWLLILFIFFKNFLIFLLVYDKLRQHIKKQRHHFTNKSPYNQSYDFSSSHVWIWELDHKEGWMLKNWCFWIMVLEKTLEIPLNCKEIKPVNPKGKQSWIFIGRNDAEAEASILWPPDARSQLIRKDPDAGKDWRQEEKGVTED